MAERENQRTQIVFCCPGSVCRRDELHGALRVIRLMGTFFLGQGIE